MKAGRHSGRGGVAGCVVLLSTFWVSNPAHASDYGCKVLLCLSNPAGPTAVSQCRPPIERLWRDLASRRPFPSCEEASSGPYSARAQIGTSYYDLCPSGTTALDVGRWAAPVGVTDRAFAGIGSGDGLEPTPDVPLNSRKICVGNRVGQINVQIGDVQTAFEITADVYDNVVVLDPAGSPSVIDVYVNGGLYRRVRW